MKYPWYETKILQQPTPWNVSSLSDYVFMKFFDFHLNYSNSYEARAGYHLIIHRNDELPSFSARHLYFWNQKTFISIWPDQVLLDDNVKNDSPKMRNCYFKYEKNLKLFRLYSKENCEHECQSLAFARSCGCVPFYLTSEIRIEVRTVSACKILFSGSKTDRACTIQDKNCSEEIASSLDREVARCRCLDRCEQFEYIINLMKRSG
jgi:acid-sensing ion channel, other